MIIQRARGLIQKKYPELLSWLNNLPLYYEINDLILVHAGIVEVEGKNELWKIYSSDDHFLMKYPAEKGYFYKDIIAGHIGTSGITGEYDFHDICQYGNHIYLDSTVDISKKLNLLKYDTETCRYTGIVKENDEWTEYPIIDRLKG